MADCVYVQNIYFTRRERNIVTNVLKILIQPEYIISYGIYIIDFCVFHDERRRQKLRYTSFDKVFTLH